MARAYLALGSNLGDRRERMRAALGALEGAGVHVLRASSLYESAPMYVLDQPAFLNAVVEAETDLTPEDLLAAAKAVERELGRQTRERNGPREIDIDLLLYANERRGSSELTLPHPRIQERPFVTLPLAELGMPVAATAGAAPAATSQRTAGMAAMPGLRIVDSPAWAGDLVSDRRHAPVEP
ncbi:MAG TPA: 2-amino-4-hydroxy-6-hydroxymethyldihydropteridine diphosphokinase [Chloroflexota bacterium]|nr:2-amino-4-hydroxy-6-hydroxymethyldihydropteridine diphosphokinase [Chloroflexota bacterium]